MSKKSDTESKTIVQTLAVLMLCFYASYFILAVIFAGGMGGIDFTDVGRIPFEHESFGLGGVDLSAGVLAGTGGDCNSCSAGTWACMVINSFLLALYIFFIAKSTKMAWDYSATVFFLHFCITCIGGGCGWGPAG